MQCVMVILNYKDCDRAIRLAKNCSNFQIIDKIVIVDNDSQDGSYEKILLNISEKIEVIKAEKNNGFSAGNNIAAKYIVKKYKPQYIFFANTDTIFKEENIIECINVLNKDNDLGLVSLRMLGPDGKEQVSWYDFPEYKDYISRLFWIGRKKYYKTRMSLNYSEGFQYVDIIRGSFMFFKADALEKAGFFDENTFLYCEETIISYRLKQIGYKVGLLTNMSYIHDHLENNSNTNLISTKRLYESKLYFAKNYLKIGIFKQILMKILIEYSILEIKFIENLKRILKAKNINDKSL